MFCLSFLSGIKIIGKVDELIVFKRNDRFSGSVNKSKNTILTDDKTIAVNNRCMIKLRVKKKLAVDINNSPFLICSDSCKRIVERCNLVIGCRYNFISRTINKSKPAVRPLTLLNHGTPAVKLQVPV